MSETWPPRARPGRVIMQQLRELVLFIIYIMSQISLRFCGANSPLLNLLVCWTPEPTHLRKEVLLRVCGMLFLYNRLSPVLVGG